MIYPLLTAAAENAPETSTSLSHWLAMFAVAMWTSAGAIVWIYADRGSRSDRVED